MARNPRRIAPEDKHVTRKELLAELVIIARAADASIAQLREEMRAHFPALPSGAIARLREDIAAQAELDALDEWIAVESIPSPAEGPE